MFYKRLLRLKILKKLKKFKTLENETVWLLLYVIELLCGTLILLTF